MRSLSQEQITSELAREGIPWYCNPPSSPHMGGIFESMVKLVKRAMKTVINDQVLPEETLHTVLVETEAIFNSRPLTPVNDDPNDYEALTPNLIGRASPNSPPGRFEECEINSRKRWRIAQALADMIWRRWRKEYLPTLTMRSKWNKDNETPNLIGRASPNSPPGRFEECEINSRKRWRIAQALADMIWRRWRKEYLPTLTMRSKWNKDNETPNLIGRASPNSPPGRFEECEINSRKRWRIAQALADMIWRRWRKEYLPTLTMRSKWNKEQRNLKEGDLILLKNDDVPRSHWPMGGILKTFPGSDGRVRMAEVNTPNGTLMRPVAKTCMLENNVDL